MNAWLAGAASLLVATTSTSVATAIGQSKSRRLAFGSGAHWILIDPVTRKVDSISLPGGHKAIQLVASHDGGVLVFTEQAAADTSLLYKWDRQAGVEPISIGDPIGYHSDPAFSHDGKWIYFAHNPSSGGGPGQHRPGAYAQIYRVRLSGGPVQQLTSSPGCHYAPAEGERHEIYWVHSTCHLLQSLEKQAADRRVTAFDTGKGLFHLLSADDSGDLLISVTEYKRTHVIRRDVHGTEAEVFDLPSSSGLLIPQAGIGDEVYYQSNNRVWLWHRGQAKAVAQIGEAR